MDNLNDKYDYVITFLNGISSKFCDENNIKLDIIIPSEYMLNARVAKVGDRQYSIELFPGCLNLDYSIEKITQNIMKMI